MYRFTELDLREIQVGGTIREFSHSWTDPRTTAMTLEAEPRFQVTEQRQQQRDRWLGWPRDPITPHRFPVPRVHTPESGHFTMSTLARQALSLTATRRGLTTAATNTTEPLTHYKITLRRSAISLPESFKATLVSLGIHRRMQTVYHPHTPECAGKVLKVKELVEVENVPASAVRTKTEQRQERKASRGYRVVRSTIS